MSAPRKRPVVGTAAGGGGKRIRTAASSATAARMAVKREDNGDMDTSVAAAGNKSNRLKDAFIKIFSKPEYKDVGINNTILKQHFGNDNYVKLAPIISDLVKKSKMFMSKIASPGCLATRARRDDNLEYFYTLVNEETAEKFKGLGEKERMVYQVVERSGNKGIWTKLIHNETGISQQALNKIYQVLEKRRVIKPVRSVKAKNKKLFMLYDLAPSKEVTGGVWYSDLEFDHAFISELRTFVMRCVTKLNGGKGVSLSQIREKMVEARVSRVQLSPEEVTQVVNTLIYDYHVEIANPEEQKNFSGGGDEDSTQPVYVKSRRINTMCEFKCWDVLTPDFEFRPIKFDDGITLAAHEHHYHTE